MPAGSDRWVVRKSSSGLLRKTNEELGGFPDDPMFRVECNTEMVQYRKQSIRRYKSEHQDLLARKAKALKNYKYTTMHLHRAHDQIAKSGGYVEDMATA